MSGCGILLPLWNVILLVTCKEGALQTPKHFLGILVKETWDCVQDCPGEEGWVCSGSLRGLTQDSTKSIGGVFAFSVSYSSEWAGVERCPDNELPSCMCLNRVAGVLWEQDAEWDGLRVPPWLISSDSGAGGVEMILQPGTGYWTKWTPKNRCRNLGNKPISGSVFQGMSLSVSLCLF